jgi:hypothetical protein
MRSALRALPALAALLLAAPVAQAVTIHVPDDQPTIAAALAVAAGGDVVLVAPGEYREHGLVLPDGVTLRGDGEWPDVPILHADGHDHVLTVTDTYSQTTRLENVFVTGSQVAAVRCAVAFAFTIDHCYFDGQLSAGRAIDVSNSTNIVVTDSWVIGWDDTGMLTAGSGPIEIANTDFWENAGGAFVGEGVKVGVTMTGCTFRKNHSSNGAGAVAVFGWFAAAEEPSGVPVPDDPHAERLNLISGCEFAGNVGEGSAMGAVYFEMRSCDLVDCSFTNNHGAATVGYVGFCGGTVERCDIVGNEGHGLFLWDHVFVNLVETVVANNQGDGINCLATARPRLERTTIAGNAGHGVCEPTLDADDDWIQSIIAFNGEAALLAYDFAATVECCLIYGNEGGDWDGLLAPYLVPGAPHNHWRDPLFCDLVAGDVMVAAMSPCVAGNNCCGVQIGARAAGCPCAGLAFCDDLSLAVAGAPDDRHYGVAAADFDDYGYVAPRCDVFFTGNAADGTPVDVLYWNDWSANPLVFTGTVGGNGIVGAGFARAAKFVDFNRNGYLDLFVGGMDGPNRLYEHNSGYVWPEHAVSAGIADPDATTQDAAWVDFDGDGGIDLYTGCTGPNRLFRNDGPYGWSYTDVAPALGLDDPGHARSVCWADYDNDGDADLYVANYDASPNRLFRNDGAVFTDVTAGSLGDPGASNGAGWGDYDGDGDLDLYLANYGAPNRLFQNQGAPGWTFVDVAPDVGLDDPGYSRGVAWVDFDNDGDLDLHVADWGDDHLYRNDGGVFVDVAPGTAAADPRSGRGVAWGDLEGDGRLDGFVANYSGTNTVLHNLVCNGNHWLQVKLIEPYGPCVQIGARLRVVAGGREQIHEVVGGTGYYSQSWMTPHFGLGEATTVDVLDIHWPDGTVQMLFDIAADQRIEVVQGSTAITTDEPGPPECLALDPAHPNPFNASTTLSYEVPAGGGHVRLSIHDLRGGLVATLVDEDRPPGRHAATWDGRDDAGRAAASGVYLARLVSGGTAALRRLTLVQ